MQLSKAKSPATRGRIVKCIQALANRSPTKLLKISSFPEVCPLLADYFEDASQEVRAKCKSCI